jgi:hypothetical protein
MKSQNVQGANNSSISRAFAEIANHSGDQSHAAILGPAVKMPTHEGFGTKLLN